MKLIQTQPPRSAYHKKVEQSIENSINLLLIEQLTLSDLREAVKGQFSSFCTAVGIQALMTLMEQDVESKAGPQDKHNPNRTAYRHGSQATTEQRSVAVHEDLPLASYEVFADDDQLLETTLHCMLYDMPTKNYGHGIDDYSDAAEMSGTSKSTVSQLFIKANTQEVGKVPSRRFDESKISVILIDGIIYTAIVVMVVTSRRRKAYYGGSYWRHRKHSSMPRSAYRSLSTEGWNYGLS